MMLNYKHSGLTVIIILVAGSIVTLGINSLSEVFAEKCKNNGDNNCNKDKIDQKSWTTNGCDLGNKNNEGSKKSSDDNLFACVNIVTNLQNLAVIPDQFAETR
jgi:hypothetical protein